MRSFWGGPANRRFLVASAALWTLAMLAGACSDESAGSADPTSSDESQVDSDANGEAAVSGQEAASEEEPGSSAAVPSPGCAGPTGEPAVKGRQSLRVGDSERWYLVTAPAAALGSEPVPLVLDFHGLSEGAEFHSNATGWSELAEREGFVAVFPNGTGRTVAWNVASSGPNPDLDFIDAMLESLGSQYCVDTSRVYATGLSNGAFMSSVIACTRSDRFAAVAPVAGVTHPPDCAPDRAVPVMAFHGTADPLLPFNGTVSADALDRIFGDGDATDISAPPGDLDGDGYPHNASQWAAANGCEDPTDERVADSIVRRSWDCPRGAEVVFYMIEGGGHTWPGSDGLTNEAIARLVGPTTFEVDATESAWEFFGSQQLPA